ncbi:MAG TPA: acyl-CoA dehydrogenase family protein [Actinomycetota bacterium]
MTLPLGHLGLSDEQRALLGLVREVAAREIAPHASAWERDGIFPREAFSALGRAGLLGLPYPEEFGGGAQPNWVYLLCLEELAAALLSVGLGTSVQVLTMFPAAQFGTDEQRKAWLPPACAGEWIGSYCLSESESGSDASALTTKATRDGDSYVIDGRKAWVTHGGESDYYMVMARTGEAGAKGISTIFVPASTPGVARAKTENKMGMKSSPTAQITFDQVRVPVENRIGEEGEGFRIAMAALDGGRLGIAACSVGLARAAFEAAVTFAKDRKQFGRPVIENQGLSWMLADMLTGIEAARTLTLDAARRRDAGAPFSTHAAMAKLFASDTAMRVTTDAVQIHGGYGYVDEFPVERYMREAKVLQIVEGTNQIQRVVIARAITRG